MARRRLRTPRDRTIEAELKFRVASVRDHAKLRAMLLKRGAKLTGRYKEDNYRFNGPGKSTRNTTLRLRVLNGGPKGVLTAKGPATFEGGVKIREETEVDVPDVHATLDLLQPQRLRAHGDRLARDLGGVRRGPEDVDEVDLVGHLEQRSIDALAEQGVRIRVDGDDPEPASLQTLPDRPSGLVGITGRAHHRDGPGALEDLMRTASHENSKHAPDVVIPHR